MESSIRVEVFVMASGARQDTSAGLDINVFPCGKGCRRNLKPFRRKYHICLADQGDVNGWVLPQLLPSVFHCANQTTIFQCRIRENSSRFEVFMSEYTVYVETHVVSYQSSFAASISKSNDNRQNPTTLRSVRGNILEPIDRAESSRTSNGPCFVSGSPKKIVPAWSVYQVPAHSIYPLRP